MATPATYYFDQWLELFTTLKNFSLDDFGPMTFAGYVPKEYMGSQARILYVCASVPNWVADVFGGGPNPLKDDAAALDFVERLGGLAGGSGESVAAFPALPDDRLKGRRRYVVIRIGQGKLCRVRGGSEVFRDLLLVAAANVAATHPG